MKTFVWKVLALALLSAPLVVLASDAVSPRTTAYDQIDLLVDVRHELVSDYVEEPNQAKMTQSAVRAMVASLNDPYTIYLTPEELAPFDRQIRGTFSGIGAEVEIDQDQKRPRIIAPLDDSPAWKAGILAGDLILEIDGESTLKMDLNDAISKLTGVEGTTVKIKVHHPDGKEVDITVTRGRINMQTVRGFRRKPDSHWDFMLDPANKIGYVRIGQFTEQTAGDFKAALTSLEGQGVRGLILDLRFDPGGLLESAVAVSDMFLPKGQRIVSVKGRVVPEHITYATDAPKFPAVPMVVIANENSASAAEIVTGALSDNHRALFVGTRTFGKGSVQQIMMLDNNEGALKITNAYYYLPNGRNIHHRENSLTWGVDPSEGCYVPMNNSQLVSMAEARRRADALMTNPLVDQATVTPESIEKDLADPQLSAGLRAVLGKLATDTWPKVGQSNAAALVHQTRHDELVRQRDLTRQRLDEIQAAIAKLDLPPATQPAPPAGGAISAATQPAIPNP